MPVPRRRGGDLGVGGAQFRWAICGRALQHETGRGARSVRTQFGYHIVRSRRDPAGRNRRRSGTYVPSSKLSTAKREAEKVFGERQEQLADKAFEHIDDVGCGR